MGSKVIRVKGDRERTVGEEVAQASSMINPKMYQCVNYIIVQRLNLTYYFTSVLEKRT